MPIFYEQNGRTVQLIGNANLPDYDLTKDVPEGCAYVICDAPADRYFREAWVIWDGAVVIDSIKAAAIQKDHWRRVRGPKLAALDVEFTKAIGRGEDNLLSIIEGKRQALRDVTATDLTGKTPAQIRDTGPECLQ